MKIDKFVIAIACSVLLAYLFPEPGSKASPVPLDAITNWGVSFIFFFYGLKLRTTEFISGLRNWKLHLLVQSTTFILFPLIVLLFFPLISGEKNKILWLAFLFLASLPSTVSSSVVMVSLAKGNVPGAIFNASISGIIGIAVTPLWLSPFLTEGNSPTGVEKVYEGLLLGILLPLIIGLVLRRWLSAYAQRNIKALTLFDKTIILLIVYKSFVHSFEEQLFSLLAWHDILIVIVLVVALFIGVYYVTGLLARRFKLNTEDCITAQFCGTKKSLVHGTVFSTALFKSSSMGGIILLPLMIFHAFQILIVSVIATRLAARNSEQNQ